jgi:hypothetical protein
VFENRLLRKMFGPKRQKVREGWETFNNDEIHDLYSLPHNIWVMKLRIRYVGHVACMRKKRNAYKVLVQNSEGKTAWETRGRWEDNIKKDHTNMGWNDVSFDSSCFR